MFWVPYWTDVPVFAASRVDNLGPERGPDVAAGVDGYFGDAHGSFGAG
jgi:hypothetical protein